MRPDLPDDDDPQDQLTQDRPFNPFRIPKTAKAGDVVADVLRQLQFFEKLRGLRQRQRRPADQLTFEATVTAVVCDLMHRTLSAPDGWVSVSLSHQHLGKAGRYRAPAMSKALPDILERLALPDMAYVKMEKGHPGYFGPARRTVLKAEYRLLSRLEELGVTLADLGQSAPREVIVLKREKASFWDDGGAVDYEDSPVTQHFRAEMEAINSWIAAGDIQFDPSVLDDGPHDVDDTNRLLRRYFTLGKFDSGGRLFGGFWQSLPKWQRRKGILIDGEDVATLDYGQMAPRILYGMVGKTPPTADAYNLPGLEAYRPGVKKVMNAVLFADKPLSRFPKTTGALFPREASMGQVIQKLEDLHSPIKHLFFTGIGHRAQFIESEVLVDVLLALKEQGIVALPIHDAVVVPRSSIPLVTKIMALVFKDHTGVDGMVMEEEG
jgi:hypothetical protein